MTEREIADDVLLSHGTVGLIQDTPAHPGQLGGGGREGRRGRGREGGRGGEGREVRRGRERTYTELTLS